MTTTTPTERLRGTACAVSRVEATSAEGGGASCAVLRARDSRARRARALDCFVRFGTVWGLVWRPGSLPAREIAGRRRRRRQARVRVCGCACGCAFAWRGHRRQRKRGCAVSADCAVPAECKTKSAVAIE
eukprot:2758350-Prymnesium_polylepis.1